MQDKIGFIYGNQIQVQEDKVRGELGEVTEKDKFRFATKILLACASIFFTTAILAVFKPEGMPIFDACKTILPPIATLVIGYYFGEIKKA